MAQIYGTARDDTLNGTTTADSIFGRGGNDALYGNGGNDSLYGGAGNDLLDGGAANDLLDGGAGIDTARYDIAAAISANLRTGTASFPGTGWASETLVSIENVVTGSGNDTIWGSDGANALSGGAGDDQLWGGGGSDTLDGGTGVDTLVGGDDYYAEGSDFRLITAWRDVARYDWATTDVVANLQNTLGIVWVTGDAPDALYSIESVWSGSGNDSLIGSEAANELRGGAGADTLRGAAGDDTLWGQGGNDLLDGGEGSDTIVYSDNTTPVRIDLAARLVTFVGQSWIPEALLSIESAVGGSGADTLIGTAGANVLQGGGGADRIDGRGGSDTVSFAGEAQAVLIDLVTLRSGAIGSTVRDTLVSIENARGGAGADRLVGNAAANVLDGGFGADTVAGGGGNDRLMLSAGNDRLDGGAGTDTLVLDQPYETYLNGQHAIGIDETGYSWEFHGPSDMTVRIDLAASATFHYGWTGTSTLAGIENVTTGVGNDHVYGSAAANVISVDHGANYVDGRGGNDTIYGSNVELDDEPYALYVEDDRDQYEIVRGGGGNDRIVGATHAFGDAGNDTLVAGWHYQQEMTGGAGADSFQFTDWFELAYYHGPAWIEQRGRVLDFDPGEGDRIVIDRVDDAAPAPVFRGEVDSVFLLEQGDYALVGDTLVYVAAREYDETSGYDIILGPSVDLADFDGTLAASDVLFI